MSTTIINPTPSTRSTASSGVFFALVIFALIIFGYLFLIYGFPLIKQGFSGLGSGEINITLPQTLDVKVEQTK